MPTLEAVRESYHTTELDTLIGHEREAPTGAEVVRVASAVDIITVRQAGRCLALELGFPLAEATLVAAAISEIARNIVDHAGEGEMRLSKLEENGRTGLEIVAQDQGPGIPDVAQAMRYGFSTYRGLGVGLPGAKWLMDEFDLSSAVAVGTTVTMRKWLAET